MTKLLYAINEAEEYNIELNHTYDIYIVTKNIKTVTKQFFDDLNTNIIQDYNTHEDIETSTLLDIINNALMDNNANVEISCYYNNYDYTIEFEKQNNIIYFKIVVFGTTNYYYEVNTLDLDNESIFL